jgi:hypothetical protein
MLRLYNTDYSIQANIDSVVFVFTDSGAITVTLPAAHNDGDAFIIKDWSGYAVVNTLEVLQDLALDIDPRRDGLSILAWQMRQQPLEVERQGLLVGFSPQRVLIGHDELAKSVDHLLEYVGGHETIAQHFLSPLCPCGCHLFASSLCPVDTRS